MYKNKRILGIIPARGGSKGLPGKNTKPLLGKPLIAWTIEQGLNSKYIDKLIVSTEDEKIADISRNYGALVPFMRPHYLASDTASSIDVIMHTINFFEEKDEVYDIVVILEPTSPLRDSNDIDESLKILLNNKESESIVGVCRIESSHPDFLVRLEKGFLLPYQKDIVAKKRQDLSDLYFFEGSVYISYIKSFKNRKCFYHEKCLGYIVPKWKSFEVDDICDFYIIEALMNKKIAGYLK